MADMPNISGIIKRVGPEEDPNPGSTLRLPAADDSYLEVTFDEDDLKRIDYYVDRIKRLEKQALQAVSVRKKMESGKDPDSKLCKLRIEIELGDKESFKWEVNLHPPHSHSKKK